MKNTLRTVPSPARSTALLALALGCLLLQSCHFHGCGGSLGFTLCAPVRSCR